jgi:hypothetical protein
MEQTLFISKADNLGYFRPVYTRLYFGVEFCERLMPAAADLKRVLDFVEEKGLEFTLVSPYVTETGLKRLRGLLEMLSQIRPGSEVVFNDYGVLRVLHQYYPGLEPVLGRLLNRMKRGPRLMTVIDKLPQTTVAYFRDSNLNVPALCEFLNAHGVGRVDLDNVLQGFGFTLERLKGSLYVPYAYVTTTRLCLANACDVPGGEERIGVFPCKLECQKYTFYLSSVVMPVMLERKGNTVFFRNDRIPDDIESRGIDRLVTQPEIPM